MHKKKEYPFIIRGFHVGWSNQPFTSFGTLDQLSTPSVEVVAPDAITAVQACYQHPALRTMISSVIMAQGNPLGFSLPAISTDLDLAQVNLKLEFSADGLFEMRPLRSGLRDILLTWAYKSRARGARGWRLSALKEPRFSYESGDGLVTVTTTALLGTAIFYTEQQATLYKLPDIDSYSPPTGSADYSYLENKLVALCNGSDVSLHKIEAIVK